MASFDPNAWRDRASSRLERELARGTKKDNASKRYASDVLAIDALEKLIAWLKRRGIKVTFEPESKGGLWFRNKRTIRINVRSRPREQYHILLHECGHIIVDLSTAAHTEGKYACGYEQVSDLKDPKQRKINVTFKHRIDVIAEEIDAWHAGKKLANRLDLVLDQDAYDSSRARALKTYVKWSLRRDADEPDDDNDDEEPTVIKEP